MARYQGASALREHMLEGNRISLLEAILLFGVQSPNRELTRMKNDGFLIKSQRVSMAKVVRRLNQFAVCQPPAELPVTEIIMTEYWISL